MYSSCVVPVVPFIFDVSGVIGREKDRTCMQQLWTVKWWIQELSLSRKLYAAGTL